MRPFDELADKARDSRALTFERKSAIQELARHDDARVAGVLEELLGDSEASIRREAINALGAVRGAGVTQFLVRALDDKERSCVKAALAQLGVRNDPAAAPALERLVETGDLGTRIEAKRLLRQLGGRAEESEEPEPRAEMRLEERAELKPAPEHEPEPPPPPPQPEAPVVERPPETPPGEEKPAPPTRGEPLEPPPEVPVAPRAGPDVKRPPVPPPPPPNLQRGFMSRRQRARLTPDSSYRPFRTMEQRTSGQDQGCAKTSAGTFGVVFGILVLLFLIGTCVRAMD